MMIGMPAGKDLTSVFHSVASESTADGLPPAPRRPSASGGPRHSHHGEDTNALLDFEEFLQVVRTMDPDEERRVADELGLSSTDLEAARVCFRSADCAGTGSVVGSGFLNQEKSVKALKAMMEG